MQCGLRAVPPDAGGVLFTLVDHPAVAPATVDALLDRPPGDGWDRPSPLVACHASLNHDGLGGRELLRVPRYQGRRGHPIWFARELIPEFLALPESGAARDVVRRACGGNRLSGPRRPRHRGRHRRPRGLSGVAWRGPMRLRVRLALKLAGAALALLLVFGLAAPYLSADRYGERLRGSLERSLGRRVELGGVHFSLFKGPGFTVDSVTIHEDPSIGNEPVAYMRWPGSLEVAPRFWSLLGGRFVIASISLDGASINLAKSGPASEWGRWNFASFVNRSVLSAAPAIHVRRSRINFKFGDAKSVCLSHPGGPGYHASVPLRSRVARGLLRGRRAHRSFRAKPRLVHVERPLVRGSRAPGPGSRTGPRRSGRNHRLAARAGRRRPRRSFGAPPPGRAHRRRGNRRPPGYRGRAPLGHAAARKAAAGPSISAAGRTWWRSSLNWTPALRAMCRCRFGFASA